MVLSLQISSGSFGRGVQPCVGNLCVTDSIQVNTCDTEVGQCVTPLRRNLSAEIRTSTRSARYQPSHPADIIPPMSEEASNVPSSPQPLVDHQQAETSAEPVLSFAQTLNPEPAVDSGSAVDSKPAPNPDPAFNPEPALNPAFALGTESSPNPEHSPDPDPALNSEPAPNSEPALESEPVLTSKVNRSSGPISTSSLASEPDSPLTPCSGDDLEPTGDVPAAGIPEQHPTDRPAVDNGQQPIYIDGEDQKAYERVTHIPPEISALFPSPMDSVESLISHNSFSPQPIGGKRLRPAKSCIVDSGVRWRKEDLLTAPIPPLQWIGDLEMELKAQLGAGRHLSALQHPTIPDLRLPLWMVSLWFVIQAIEAQKTLWTEAVTWLSSDAVTGEEVDCASELIKQLKWGTTIWPLLEPTTLIGLVAELLSTRWLRERHLDLWGLYLTCCAGEGVRDFYIGGVYIAQVLKQLPAGKEKGMSWAEQGTVFDTLAIVVKEGFRTILLPANLNQNHWVLFRIDLDKKTFCYGKEYQLSRHSHGY